MHDGRARSIPEAILWHYGEGTVSRNAFLAMNAQQRADLVRYTQYPFADRLSRGAPTPIAVRNPAGSIISFARPLLACFPNPIRTIASLQIKNIVCGKGDTFAVSVYNLQGKLVFSQAMRPGQSAVSWNAAMSGAGKYIALLFANGRVFRKDLLVMR
jgi:hypothetical protein